MRAKRWRVYGLLIVLAIDNQCCDFGGHPDDFSVTMIADSAGHTTVRETHKILL